MTNLDKLSYAADQSYFHDILIDPNTSSRCRFIHGDCCDLKACLEALSTEGVDIIYHFAVESHVDHALSAPLFFANSNKIGTITLLEAYRNSPAVKSLISRFVYISTDV